MKLTITTIAIAALLCWSWSVSPIATGIVLIGLIACFVKWASKYVER